MSGLEDDPALEWTPEQVSAFEHDMAINHAGYLRVPVGGPRSMFATRLGGKGTRPFEDVPYRGDCGLDLAITEDLVIQPGQMFNAACGVAVALPPGTFGWITGRSSTWSKWGLQVMPGVIDEGWRGELRAMLFRPYRYATVTDLNDGAFEPYLRVPAGTRLAQLIVLPNMLGAIEINFVRPDELPSGSRGEKGFGSSG